MSLNTKSTLKPDELWIEISIPEQRLWLRRGEEVLMEMPASTAKNGAGEQFGSECTPRGWHQIRARIGDGCEGSTVFVGRRPTGEIYTSQLNQQQPGRDWILTRILWLSGLEPGRNRLGSVDTMRRYIYIHGVPDEADMNIPGSHGCVRLRDDDLMRLFDIVPVGTRVLVNEH